jgi:deoxyribonuclease V
MKKRGGTTLKPGLLENETGRLLLEGSLSPADAAALQLELAERVVPEDGFSGPPLTVAGVDVSIRKAPGGDRAVACIAVMEWGSWRILSVAIAEDRVRFPYIPGLLSFRELPVILKAADRLSEWPGLFMVDGAGMAHPRFFGLACHLGVVSGCPSVGVAKSRLVGTHAPLPEGRGSRVSLLVGGRVAGTVLRTRSGVRPLYVSPGHFVSLETAADLVLASITRFRLPEPIRAAHKLAGDQNLLYS